MNNHSLRRVVLEVERKFSRLKTYPLKLNGGVPSFRALVPLGIRSFRDVYYDHQGLLASSGTWARQRDGKWQVKARQAGDFNQSQFRELHDLREIQHHIGSILKRPLVGSDNFGLSVLADITTRRESWKADNHFTIVLDHADFGHTVGEVELESLVAVHSAAQERQLCVEMDQQISDFMHRYRWAFDTGPVVGKLTAYFDRQNMKL